MEAKKPALRMKWKKSIKDHNFSWDVGVDAASARLLNDFVFSTKNYNNKTLAKELEERGFDLETFKIEIRKK